MWTCRKFSYCVIRFLFWNIDRLMRGIQDSLGFWIPRRGFRISGIGSHYFSVQFGFWIPIVSGIPDSLSCIPDSKAQDSEFRKQKIFRIPESLKWGRDNAVSWQKLITVGTVSAPFLTKSIREKQSRHAVFECTVTPRVNSN